MSTYLPPVIINITASDKRLVGVLARDKALLADFAKETYTPKLGLDDGNAQKSILDIKLELLDLAKQARNLAMKMDIGDVLTKLQEVKADVDRLSPLDISLDLHTAAALAKFEALKEQMATIETTSVMANIGIPLGGGGGDSGGGGGKGGLMSLLGFGGGAFGAAGAGSIAGMAGFGTHSLGSALAALGVSGAGAAAGGGLMAGASLGVAGVGGITDMAGMGQAANDIKAVYQAQNQLNLATAQYGPNSIQAAAAANNFKYVVSSIGPAAQGSVVAAEQAAQNFHTLFDQLTGPAEAVGAQIIQSFMGMAQKYLPTIGKFALKNMQIIKSGIQPFLNWMAGPGLAIFNKLETVFSQHLPTAVHMFTQALELIFKTIGYLAPATGKLVAWFDKLFTRMNSTAGFSKWETEVNKLVGIFHDWVHLLVAVGHAIKALFSHDAGTGTALINEFTKLVNEFTKWANTVHGGDTLHSLFESHKKELLEVIPLIIHLGSAFGQAEIQIEPMLMTLVKLLAQVATAIMKIPGVGNILALAVAFGILWNKMKLIKLYHGVDKQVSNLMTSFQKGTGAVGMLGRLGKAMKAFSMEGGLGNGLKTFATSLRAIGPAGEEAAVGEEAAAGGATLMETALGLGALGAIIALGAGIYELVKHWHTVWTEIKRVVRSGVSFVRQRLSILIAAFGPVALAIKFLADNWKAILNGMEAVARVAWTAIKTILVGSWNAIVAVLRPGISLMVSYFKIGWAVIAGTAKVAWAMISSIVKIAWAIVSGIIKVGLDLIQGKWGAAWNAVKATFASVWSAIQSVGIAVWNALETAFTKGIQFILKIASDLLALASHLPFVGGKFASLRKSVDNFSNSLNHSGKEAQKAGATHAKVAQKMASDYKKATDKIVVDNRHLVSSSNKSAHQVSSSYHKAYQSVAQHAQNNTLKARQSHQQLSQSAQKNSLMVSKSFTTNYNAIGTNATKVVGQVQKQNQVLVKSATQTGKQVQQGMVAPLKTITRQYTQAIATIHKAFEALTKEMPSIGMDMMRGLAQGITQGTAMVVAAAMAAGQAAAAALRAATQTHSPSLLFAKIGHDWLLGLSQGVTNGIGSSLLPAMAKVGATAGGLPKSLSTIGGAGVGAGGGGSAYQVHYNVTVNAPTGNGNDIARALKRTLDAHDRQLAQVLRAGAAS